MLNSNQTRKKKPVKKKKNSKLGRPRLGSQVKKPFSVGLEPNVKKTIEKEYGSLRLALEHLYFKITRKKSLKY